MDQLEGVGKGGRKGGREREREREKDRDRDRVREGERKGGRWRIISITTEKIQQEIISFIIYSLTYFSLY